MMALRKAVKDGLIDCIASHHIPQDWDHKTCEFEYAAHGMIGLQTVFAVVNESIPELTEQQLVALLSDNARNIFGLSKTNIEEGAVAELTLFSRTAGSMLQKENLKSKSANSAFINTPFKGAVLATIHRGQIHQP